MDLSVPASGTESVPAAEGADEELLSDPSTGEMDETGDDGTSGEDGTHSGIGDSLSLDECVACAAEQKTAGNVHFKAGEAADACQCYQLGVQYLSKHTTETSAKEVLLSLQNNLAATQNQLGLWDDAVASATAVLGIEEGNVKALFRRGVAYFNLEKLDTAKADLSTVCRNDTKNREARTILASVNAALQQAKEQQKASMKNLFAGKSLYHAEEQAARRKAVEDAKKKREEEERKKEQEEALRGEWHAECERLRAEAAASAGEEAASPMKVSGAAAAGVEAGEGVDTETGEAGTEEVEAPPITFEVFKEQREKAEKAEREKREAAEKERADAERDERMRARLKATADVVKVEDEEDLGNVRGYKKRADGTTTTYFDRQVDEKTRTMLDQLKAPKRIDTAAEVSPSAAGRSSSGGSAWNKAGTWEEKDISTWTQQLLKDKLAGVSAKADVDMQFVLQEANLGSASLGDAWLGLPLLASVREVKSVEGTASVSSSRGTLRHMVDLSFEIEWEVAAEQTEDGKGGADAAKPGKPYKGTLSYSDLTSATAYDTKLAFKKKTLSEGVRKRVGQAVDSLKAELALVLAAFFTELKTKTL
uniref:Activator of Hsp90 ATPase AHSA1-like N-terminal domain-containing protein n=1 Tax=Coccolithus braarudii TaxID=221442 RepID=A0A7S0LGA3_9EUKA|mmetsp:Transcript_38948/g.83013  ORF Transcript_38948/g.83013 Transcript_38948/m.83013 type:complete len:593 (+) Transcript_38948:168-1946(+)